MATPAEGLGRQTMVEQSVGEQTNDGANRTRRDSEYYTRDAASLRFWIFNFTCGDGRGCGVPGIKQPMWQLVVPFHRDACIRVWHVWRKDRSNNQHFGIHLDGSY